MIAQGEVKAASAVGEGSFGASEQAGIGDKDLPKFSPVTLAADKYGASKCVAVEACTKGPCLGSQRRGAIADNKGNTISMTSINRVP